MFLENLIVAMKKVWRPTPISERPNYREAVAFRESIEPAEGVEYEWVYEYGKALFADTLAIYKGLDEKADTIIKHLGGGTGLFTLGVLAKIDHQNFGMVACTLPSFLAALIAIRYAMQARRPSPATIPPSIEGAFGYATQYKTEALAKASFIGQWHEVMTGLDEAVRIRSKRVKTATGWFFATVSLLILPVGFAIIWASRQPDVARPDQSSPKSAVRGATDFLTSGRGGAGTILTGSGMGTGAVGLGGGGWG